MPFAPTYGTVVSGRIELEETDLLAALGLDGTEYSVDNVEWSGTNDSRTAVTVSLIPPVAV